jgi:hypothetical protein
MPSCRLIESAARTRNTGSATRLEAIDNPAVSGPHRAQRAAAPSGTPAYPDLFESTRNQHQTVPPGGRGQHPGIRVFCDPRVGLLELRGRSGPSGLENPAAWEHPRRRPNERPAAGHRDRGLARRAGPPRRVPRRAEAPCPVSEAVAGILPVRMCDCRPFAQLRWGRNRPSCPKCAICLTVGTPRKCEARWRCCGRSIR